MEALAQCGEEPKSLCSYFWASVFQWTLGWFLALAIMAMAMGIDFIAWFSGYRVNYLEAIIRDVIISESPYCTDLYNFRRCGKVCRLAPWQCVWPLVAAFLQNHLQPNPGSSETTMVKKTAQMRTLAVTFQTKRSADE